MTCTRTPGCPKPAGHKGFCPGHTTPGGGRPKERPYDVMRDDPDWDPMAEDTPPEELVTPSGLVNPAALEKARTTVLGKSAASAAASLPRHSPIIGLSPAKAKLVEGLTDSKVRSEHAKAELAETELELKKLELETQRGSLVRVEDCKLLVEEAHLQWKARLDKVAEKFAEKVADSEIGAGARDACRDLLELCITEICEAVSQGREA